MRRFRKRRRGRRLNRRGFFTLVLLFCLAAAGLIEWRIHSVFSDVTYQQVQRMVTQAVEETVEEVSGQEFALVEMTQGEDGVLQSLTVDSAAMNRVKSQVALGVQERLSGEGPSAGEHGETGIPLGTLLGSALLHGRGPSVPLRVTADGNVQVDYESSFSSAGVNQTCHRIVLTVKVEAFSYVPGASSRVESETSAVLTETIIVGQVPQLMTTWPAAE